MLQAKHDSKASVSIVQSGAWIHHHVSSQNRINVEDKLSKHVVPGVTHPRQLTDRADKHCDIEMLSQYYEFGEISIHPHRQLCQIVFSLYSSPYSEK